MICLPHEPKSDDVVCYEFKVVLARLFETKNEDDELLTPVGGLHEVVTFKVGFHVPVGVV